MPGGFLGVDVFFVISGYLITNIILREIDSNSFSLRNFYKRRVRRLLPTLLFIQLFFIPIAYFLLLPNALIEFSESILASTFFISNYYFYFLDTYSAQANELKPFIHTWSLAIEEQYYLVIPLLLLFLTNVKRILIIPILVSIVLFSLSLAEKTSYQILEKGDYAFFMLQTRAWELGIGALIAVLEVEDRISTKPSAKLLLSVIGLLLIFYGFIYYNENMPHPSLLTLPIVMGTTFVILGGNNAFIKVLLANRLTIGIGLISYSLYLWHQPVFAFGRIYKPELNLFDIVLLISLTTLLSVCSFKYIERPFRDAEQVKDKKLLVILGSITVAIVVFTSFIQLTDGAAHRYPDYIKQALLNDSVEYDINTNCERLSNKCIYWGNSTSPFGLVTLGDSHAKDLTRQLMKQLPKVSYIYAAYSRGCAYQLMYDVRNEEILRCSKEQNIELFNQIMSLKNPIVILNMRLPLYVENEGFGIDIADEYGLFDTNSDRLNYVSYENTRMAIADTITQLVKNNIRVVLIYPIPEMGEHIPSKVLEMMSLGSMSELSDASTQINIDLTEYRNRTYRSKLILDSIQPHPNLIRIYPEKLFCDDKQCKALSERNLLYRDDDHLSSFGVDLLLKEIQSEIVNKWDIKLNQAK